MNGQQIVSVQLEVREAVNTNNLQYGLFDVSTNAVTLNNSNSGRTDIYADLGSGTQYGTYGLTAGTGNGVDTFLLNAAGLADVSAAVGQGYFSLGGAVLNGTTGQYVYGFSNATPQHLIITTSASSVTPEGSSLAMFALGGLPLVVGFGRRLRRKTA